MSRVMTILITNYIQIILRSTRPISPISSSERGHRHEGAPHRTAGAVAAAPAGTEEPLRTAPGYAAPPDQGHQ